MSIFNVAIKNNVKEYAWHSNTSNPIRFFLVTDKCNYLYVVEMLY